MRNTERLYDRVIEKMDMTCDMEDEELQELIHEVLEEASKEEFIPLQEKIRISKELFNAFRKLDILQELIEDDEITEIMINGTDHIFLEKAGRIFEWFQFLKHMHLKSKLFSASDHLHKVSRIICLLITDYKIFLMQPIPPVLYDSFNLLDENTAANRSLNKNN